MRAKRRPNRTLHLTAGSFLLFSLPGVVAGSWYPRRQVSFMFGHRGRGG
ncbi:MAG: hypothetical protein JWO38_6173 [Gemmataceae bacterium]|nr:hypothetical protein [Gemmataceae bacterium]